MSENNFFITLTCRHCGNVSNMLKVGYFQQEQQMYDPDMGDYTDGSGEVYMGLKCPACTKVNIVKYYVSDHMEDTDIERTIEFLFPIDKEAPRGLPPQILSDYIKAEKIKAIDVHAYATSVRRLLERVCLDKGAKKDYLYKMLAELASKSTIPPALVEIAKGLKEFGNIAAHAGEVELSEIEAPILTDLCNAILEYIYSAPYLTTIAENTLQQVRNRSKAKL